MCCYFFLNLKKLTAFTPNFVSVCFTFFFFLKKTPNCIKLSSQNLDPSNPKGPLLLVECQRDFVADTHAELLSLFSSL